MPQHIRGQLTDIRQHVGLLKRGRPVRHRDADNVCETLTSAMAAIVMGLATKNTKKKSATMFFLTEERKYDQSQFKIEEQKPLCFCFR